MDVDYAPPPGIFAKFRKFFIAARWLMHALTVLVALLFVAGFNAGAAVLGFALAFCLACLWLGLLIITFLARRSPAKPTRSVLHFLVAPILLTAAAILASTDIPLHAAFYFSRPAMDRLIAEIETAPPGTPLPSYRDFGLFDASDIQITPSGIHFRSDWGNPFDWNGFAYCTTPPPAEDLPFYDYEHLSGNWYMCMRE